MKELLIQKVITLLNIDFNMPKQILTKNNPVKINNVACPVNDDKLEVKTNNYSTLSKNISKNNLIDTTLTPPVTKMETLSKDTPEKVLKYNSRLEK